MSTKKQRRAWAIELGKKGGRKKSEAKKRAALLNIWQRWHPGESLPPDYKPLKERKK